MADKFSFDPPCERCHISANCSYVTYFPGYGEVNIRVYLDGWHKQVMQLYTSVVLEATVEMYC